jgi:hypothetical protein
MRRRRFTEIDLRDMMERATEVKPSHEIGRWLLVTEFEGEEWRVVVEPDLELKVLVEAVSKT